MTPAPERYKEIQQALIDKAYLQGPASGVWGPDCSQALKKFQQEQNLTPSGKLDALSLISLGLGPNREPYRPTAVVNNRPPSSGGLR
jgi:peptidoglycan hydrolase-like protein with peptidoglycan-binding domain